MERRLAAILAADIVGYSRMMGADEAAALAALTRFREGILAPAIAQHRGRIIKQMGDGWLIEFLSSSDAVGCATAIQTALSSAEDSATQPLALRIGVHLGDIVHEAAGAGDVFGDGVNVAARLEAVAAPGGIAISDQLYLSLDGTARSAFADSGSFHLKNIARPVQVWHWPAALARRLDAAADDDSTPTILIEPFEQVGGGAAAESIAAELRDELFDSLFRRPGIKVIRAAESGALPTYRLSGRCRVAGNRCRTYLSMTTLANGETFWSTKIDAEIADVFDFLDDSVEKVSAALRAHINAFAGAVFAARPDATLSVQQLLSKAAFYFHHFDAKNAALSRETMDAAFARAPENPMVLAMLSYAIMQTVVLAVQRVEDIDAEKVMALADKSVYLGPNVDFVFHNRAKLRLWLRRDHQGCLEDAARGLAVNPNYHLAKEDIALARMFGGSPAEGAADLKAMIDRVPADPIVPLRLSFLAVGCLLAGDREAALRHAKDAYDRKPLVPMQALAFAMAAAGQRDITEGAAFRELLQRHDLRAGDAARLPLASAADEERLADLLRAAGLPD
ncbi:MAG TPA: adenylate/guanylate cyclase domain-containing protein [Kiloniellaceae bacterium]|nr:adenylate/guanylate cyclase domain-containing protein [Kiloniellaceae bacterium]